MSKKKDKNRRIKDMLKRIRESQDLVFNMQDPTTKFIPIPELQQGGVYIANFDDNFVRSCMWPILEIEGITDITDEELAQILVENGIFDDGQLAAFVWTYLQDYKEEGNNVDDYARE